jgi:hypothetical protein
MIRTILSTPEQNTITPEKVWTVQALAAERTRTLDDLVASLEGLEKTSLDQQEAQLPKGYTKEVVNMHQPTRNNTVQSSPIAVISKTDAAQVSTGLDIDSIRERLDQLAKPASESHVAELMIAPGAPDSYEYKLPAKL